MQMIEADRRQNQSYFRQRSNARSEYFLELAMKEDRTEYDYLQNKVAKSRKHSDLAGVGAIGEQHRNNQ